MPTVALPGNGSCVDQINASFAGGFSFTISAFTDFYRQFTALNDETSLTLLWGPFCNTEVFELVVIFDNVIPLSWGVLVQDVLTPAENHRSPSIQPFPVSFGTFEMVIHSITNNIYYQTSPRLRYTL